MEKNNSIFIELIRDMENEIKDLKGIYENDKKYVDEIDGIISKLRNIQYALKPKDKILKNRIKDMELILNNIESIRWDTILSEIDSIYENIRRNLLDGMSLKSLENSNIRIITF